MYKENFPSKKPRLVRRVLLTVTAAYVFVLTSCAGVGLLSSAQSEFDKGLAFFNAGEYEDAIVCFKRATELDPNFGRAHLYLGRSYLNLDRWSEAVAPLRAAYRLSPGETKREIANLLLDALFGAAVYEFNQGNFQDSASFLREIFKSSQTLQEQGMTLSGHLLPSEELLFRREGPQMLFQLTAKR